MTDLERIEADHPYTVCLHSWASGTGGVQCRGCGMFAVEDRINSLNCDVVKLARVLAQFVRAVKYTSGVSLEFAASEAERVLSEVAGGKP